MTGPEIRLPAKERLAAYRAARTPCLFPSCVGNGAFACLPGRNVCRLCAGRIEERAERLRNQFDKTAGINQYPADAQKKRGRGRQLRRPAPRTPKG